MTLVAEPPSDVVAFWNDMPAAKFERDREILRDGAALVPCQQPDGSVVMPSSSWRASARRPG